MTRVRRGYELPAFLGEQVPVELVSRLLSAEEAGRSVVLRCATDRHEPTLQGYYGTYTETVRTAPVPGEVATVRIDVCTDHILRVRYAPGHDVPSNDTPMVEASFAEQPAGDVTMVHDERAVHVVTPALRLDVEREPFRLVLRDRAGTVLWSTRAVDIASLRRARRQWRRAEQRWLFLHRFAYPLGCAREHGRTAAFASFDLRHDERVYGLGEDFGPLAKNGTYHRLWLQEAFSNSSLASYKQVPFHISTRGYGMYVNTSNALAYHVGDLDHSAMSVTVEDAAFLDLWLIGGPRISDVLPRYTSITGRAALPPLWSFGLWMSRISYQSQDEVDRTARQLREHRIPCDVVHIDTGWFREDYVCDLCFDPERFPDPAGMCQRLAELGLRVSLWQWPNVHVHSTLFAEGHAGGHFARRASGHVYLQPGGYGEDAAVIDYSSPAAVEWVQHKLASLFALGVGAIKVDYGEGAPADAVYAGVESAAMHNRYPLLYARAVWEASVKARGEGDALLWARAAWAGSQRYPVHWSGDGVARYEDLPCVVRAMLSFALSGFAFYSHDIGGFSGVPDPRLYVRWAQLGFFSSHVRAHGTPPREPWEYGSEAEQVFRAYAELRYRLLPYIWTEAQRCTETGLPFVRPLVLDFQDDPTTWVVDDQYLFGDRMLVAPVLDDSDGRRVYLPHGTWFDFWTKRRCEGGRWLDVHAPLEVLPLFVRGGAVLPLGPVQQHVGERTLDPLTVEVYGPESDGEYVVRAAPGPIRITYQRRGDGEVSVDVDGAPGHVHVVVHGKAR